jgi:hypothetical protein
MPSIKSPSAKLSQALLKGNFALAEKNWLAGARWGEPYEKGEVPRRKFNAYMQLDNGLVWFEHNKLWFNRAMEQTGTALWDFLHAHEAPLCGKAPTAVSRQRLLSVALNRGRLDMANWVLERGVDTTGVAPFPRFWFPNEQVPHDTHAATWFWALDHCEGIGPQTSEASAPDVLLRVALYWALEDSAFAEVVSRLIQRGADVTTVLPSKTDLVGLVPMAVTQASLVGGNALHAAVTMAVQSNSQLIFMQNASQVADRLQNFLQVWDQLLAAGVDPKVQNNAGHSAFDLLTGTGPIENHWRTVQTARQRAQKSSEWVPEPAVRRSRFRS